MIGREARVAITGAAGFLGSALTRALLSADGVVVDGERRDLGSLLLLDLFPVPVDLAADPRVETVTGELSNSLASLDDVDVVFHLAGVVSGAAESDFDLGMATNVDALRDVLERCRRMVTPPVVVFTSSRAVYGSDPAIGPVGAVDDDTLPRPQSSYGIQKFVGEQLVADYTRKGFVRGRTARLMTVTVRPGAPNAAASSFISGIIREPLAGIPAVCPVPAHLPIAVSSPRKTLDGVLCAAAVAQVEWGSTTAMNLPSLTTSPTEMAEALARVAGPGTAALITWHEDPAIVAIVGSWPASFRTDRATRLGLTAETTFDDIVRQYVATTAGPHA